MWTLYHCFAFWFSSGFVFVIDPHDKVNRPLYSAVPILHCEHLFFFFFFLQLLVHVTGYQMDLCSQPCSSGIK